MAPGAAPSERRVADQPAREHAIGDHRHAQRARRRQDVLLDAAARPANIRSAARRSGKFCAARFKRAGGDLRQADVAHIAGLDQIRDGAERVLDRHRAVVARRLIEVDVVGLQPAQGIGEEVLHRGGPQVVAGPAAVGRRRAPNFTDRKARSRFSAFERLADQHFVVAHAVEIAGVDQRDPGLERGVDGGDALGVVGRAVAARHGHAAEPGGGNGLVAIPKLHGTHVQFRSPAPKLSNSRALSQSRGLARNEKGGPAGPPFGFVRRLRRKLTPPRCALPAPPP